jgi:opacity protein-like surface antigen
MVDTQLLIVGFDALMSAATAAAVIVAARQLTLAKDQAMTDFEDNLNQQYREITKNIPVEALLGGSLSADQQKHSLGAFYHYFDLSNEQAFLRKQERIRPLTWDDWQEGIAQNLRKPAFSAAWQEITRRSTSFDDLKGLVPVARELAFKKDSAKALTS